MALPGFVQQVAFFRRFVVRKQRHLRGDFTELRKGQELDLQGFPVGQTMSAIQR